MSVAGDGVQCTELLWRVWQCRWKFEGLWESYLFLCHRSSEPSMWLMLCSTQYGMCTTCLWALSSYVTVHTHTHTAKETDRDQNEKMKWTPDTIWSKLHHSLATYVASAPYVYMYIASTAQSSHHPSSCLIAMYYNAYIYNVQANPLTYHVHSFISTPCGLSPLLVLYNHLSNT